MEKNKERDSTTSEVVLDLSEIDEAEWLHAAGTSASYAFLNDAIEEIYTRDDGKPFEDKN